MPKQGRVADTIQFIKGLNVVGPGQDLGNPIGEWLEELTISPAVDQAMSQGTAGTEQTRKYRRAMTLILCALNNVPPTRAQQMVAQYSDANLPTALGTMFADVQRVAAPLRLNPQLTQLQLQPATFLAANRIKIGKGTATTSGTMAFEFSWDSRSGFYLMEPPVAWHHYLHVTFQGFNIAVTTFRNIAGNLAQIPAAVVQGSNMGLTTQLSGCTIFYSVTGGHLRVTHIWPEHPDVVRANLPGALTAQAALPVGALLALRIAHEGSFAAPLIGGTEGIFGMVADPADVGLRTVGPNNIRMHGYSDTLGNAYFIAVQIGGNWHLFGQQNDPRNPQGGVSNFQQLYP